MTKTFEELEQKVLTLENLISRQKGVSEQILSVVSGLESLERDVTARIKGLEMGSKLADRSLAAHGDSIGELRELHGSHVAKILERIVDLENRVQHDVLLASRVRELEILLEGDKLTRTEWAKQKALGVTPNIPEPPTGVLQAIDNTFASMQKQMEDLFRISGKVSEVSSALSFITRLEAFFGPMLRDKNPPLDGNQIADKAYVDEAVARAANALRSEFTAAAAFVAQILKAFARAGEDVIGDTVSVQIMRATSRIVSAWEWVRVRDHELAEAEKAKRNRPSRIRSLIYAVTGNSPTNGAPR